MGMKISINLAKFKQDMAEQADKFNRATRPAAQAGAQIIYDRAKALAPVSDDKHYFYIRGTKYGPYQPGNLRDSIYQAFSKDKSFRDVSTYHVSWNKDKAPYGYMVELGTSTAAAHSFIGRSLAETRSQVREVMRQRFIEEVSK